MRRFLPYALILLAGCGQTTVSTVTKLDDGTEPPAEIDFASWPTATPESITIFSVTELLGLCRAPLPTDLPEYQQKVHGPHFAESIVVRVNPEAIDLFKSRTTPMPVGTIVIKEKRYKGLVDSLRDYTAMVKREAGYDPEHGDWEYLYVVRERGEKLSAKKDDPLGKMFPVAYRLEAGITRGKLGSCIDCHEGKKDQDYLFRTYLPAASPPANGIK